MSCFYSRTYVQSHLTFVHLGYHIAQKKNKTKFMLQLVASYKIMLFFILIDFNLVVNGIQIKALTKYYVSMILYG